MKDLTVGKESTQIIRFSIPMLLGSVFQQLYTLADSIIIGRNLGNEALTAVGNTMPIIFGLISLVIGIAMGGTIVISQFYGAKDYNNLRKAIDTIFIFLFLSALILSAIGIISSRHLLRLVNIPQSSEDIAVSYFNIYMMGIVLFFGYNGVSAILRGMGDSVTPLYFLIFASIINILLDLLFIVKFNMGVEGAALATIIAQGSAFFTAVFYLNKTHRYISFRIKNISFDWDIFRKSMRISLPTGFQQTFVAIGMAALYGIVNHFKEPVPSAYTAAGRIDMLAVIPAMTFSQALATFVGQNIGAGKTERIKKGLYSTLLFSSVTCTVITIIIVTSGPWLISLFADKAAGDLKEFKRIGTEYLVIVSSFYLVLNTMFIYNGVLRGAGDTLVPMFITLLSLWFIRIPVAYVLSARMGESGIWWAIPVAWLIGMCFSFFYYKSGRWKNKSVISVKNNE